MRLLARVLIAITGTAALAVPAGAVTMQGYSGNWPVTVTHSHHSNGTGCLTLNDGGSQGWRHSGFATLVFGGTKFTYGTFQIINHTLVATIQAPGYSQNAGIVFAAPATRGNLGRGVYDEVYGGEDFDSGALTIGTKGGC